MPLAPGVWSIKEPELETPWCFFIMSLLERSFEGEVAKQGQNRAGLLFLLQLQRAMTRVVSRLGPRGYSFFLGSLWQRQPEQLPSGHTAETHVGGWEAWGLGGWERRAYEAAPANTGVVIIGSVRLAVLAVLRAGSGTYGPTWNSRSLEGKALRKCWRLPQDTSLLCRVELPTPNLYLSPPGLSLLEA